MSYCRANFLASSVIQRRMNSSGRRLDVLSTRLDFRGRSLRLRYTVSNGELKREMEKKGLYSGQVVETIESVFELWFLVDCVKVRERFENEAWKNKKNYLRRENMGFLPVELGDFILAFCRLWNFNGVQNRVETWKKFVIRKYFPQLIMHNFCHP